MSPLPITTVHSFVFAPSATECGRFAPPYHLSPCAVAGRDEGSCAGGRNSELLTARRGRSLTDAGSLRGSRVSNLQRCDPDACSSRPRIGVAIRIDHAQSPSERLDSGHRCPPRGHPSQDSQLPPTDRLQGEMQSQRFVEQREKVGWNHTYPGPDALDGHRPHLLRLRLRIPVKSCL